MKKFITVVLLLVVCLVAVGFYRGWFAVSSSNADNGNDKVNVNLTMDRGKMKDDAEAVRNRTEEMTGKMTGGETTATPTPDTN